MGDYLRYLATNSSIRGLIHFWGLETVRIGRGHVIGIFIATLTYGSGVGYLESVFYAPPYLKQK